MLAAWWTQVAADGRTYLNADLVYLPTLLEDVLGRGNPYRAAWHLTPAPYFFPDGLLALLGWLVTPRVELQQALAAGLQLLLLAGCSRAAAAAALGRPAAALGPTVVAVAMAAGLAGHGPFPQVWTPAYHTGVPILALASTALVLGAASHPGRWRAPLLAVLWVAGAASDSLLLVGPAAATALLLAWGWRWRATARWGPAWRSGAVLVAASLAGYALGRVVVPFPDRAQHDLRLLQLPATLATAWADWTGFDVWARASVLGGLVLLGLVSALPRRDPATRLAAAAWGLSTLGTLAGILLTGNLNDARWDRYLLLPALGGPLGLAALAAPWRASRVALVALGAGLVSTRVAPLRWPPALPPFSLAPDVACLDELADREGAHLVLGEYWQVKPVTLLSRRGVRVAQVTPDLRGLSLWINSRAWYRPSGEAGLVLTDGLAPAGLERLGPEFEAVSCGALHLRVYHGEARRRLARWLEEEAGRTLGPAP